MNSYIITNGTEPQYLEANAYHQTDIRSCPNCRKEYVPYKNSHGYANTKGWDAIDGCLGMIPDVRFACCGHGGEHGYIYYLNGIIIRGTTEWIRKQAQDGYWGKI